MPWWIWLMLSLFMVAMLVAGFVYAALHGLRALKGMGGIGSHIGRVMSRMNERIPVAQAEAPAFTRPLRDMTDRYVDAHAVVVERREAKRDRHAQLWAQWSDAMPDDPKFAQYAGDAVTASGTATHGTHETRSETRSNDTH